MTTKTFSFSDLSDEPDEDFFTPEADDDDADGELDDLFDGPSEPMVCDGDPGDWLYQAWIEQQQQQQ